MINSNTSDVKASDTAVPIRLMPSEFMKELRPEYYSDTEDHATYALDAPTFGHHLDTITNRNQTHEFELFTRKLCERAICPNLRPQTGPEGGGDSKADTETYPVSEEISRIYIGEANSGQERWAFAFSAKKKWTEKVRSDVAGIIGTGRPYKRIICVTSRYARAKDRSRVEDELSGQFGIPVTIHDRSWIMKEVIENDRKDIAFNYLGIGKAKSDPLRLGPTDYSRVRQLDTIEKSFDDAEAYRGMEWERVTEALVAAKLSRSLERPRTETDGRFLRAIRLAKAHGSYRQKLEVQYEHIWTSFWWFDDIQLVNDAYDAFEVMALKSGYAGNIEFLSNLFQLLVNAVIHGHISREGCKLDERMTTLRIALNAIAVDSERPNNSLEAQTSLLILRVNSAIVNGRREDLPEIWRDYCKVLEQADGLGEFKAMRLISTIEVVGQVAGNDATYNELIENLAKFVAKRTSESEGAIILLRRAQQLDLSDRIDMIRLLGKSVIGLSKKEHTESLVAALHLLMMAYRATGLLWAARASCIIAAASLVIAGEEESTVQVSFVPTMKIWAWIALELRILPDVLYAINLMNGALRTLPLTDDSARRVSEDISELDASLGAIFLSLDDSELHRLEDLPDILEGLGLYVARTALLYTLGYASLLREDGSLPQAEPDDEVSRTFSILASQPVVRQTRGPLILHDETRQYLSATVLGMTVEVTFEGTEQLTLVAEGILSSMQAFFATLVDHCVVPHTERFQIKLIEDSDAPNPTINTNALDMTTTVKWPTAILPTNNRMQHKIGVFFAQLCEHLLSATCIIDSIKDLLNKLHDDESVRQRMAMIITTPISHHRVASRSLSQISDWKNAVQRNYPLQLPRPQLTLTEFKENGAAEERADIRPGDRKIRSHREILVRSVIDVHAWDQARWSGLLYIQFGPRHTPGIAFMFSDKEAATKIFTRWRERFGRTDTDEEIYLAIVRHIPLQNPHHYVLLITSKHPNLDGLDPDQSFIVANRSMTMTPDTSANLQHFLDAYSQFGEYYLLPAVVRNGVPEVIQELAILKHRLSVKDAADVGEHEIEAMALSRRSRAESSVRPRT